MDLSLRILADASETRTRSDTPSRCGCCGAPWERSCSYCGRDAFVPVILGSEFILPRKVVERMREPSDGRKRRD